MIGFVGGFFGGEVKHVNRNVCGRAVVRAQADGWTSVGTKDELMAAGGKKVLKYGDGKVLIKEFAGDVFAVSNSCPHLKLPLEGRVMKAKYSDEGTIQCAAHGTKFSLKTGEVDGPWCPGMPNLPFVGKMTEEKPLPTFEVKIEGDEIFIK